ncbi:helix-turn-helix domain-containing protein [Patescibacteria group bacterium]|nr:helix-turn-helix domain-containing protein [Patescibacteria group bacterium]MBU4000288.1 helix-turn-helix domain-containing protein [Patescibacteria group bacterium]MBU4057098.1 helix-turn-helix domain-containing protein [Patescibacteria group bacterium]MBU4368476.1 helix-turn-helix domain-containing protein [Patescibacteria group bacterium]
MKKELKELGLTDKETDLYLAGLKLGPATAQKLAEVSEVKRPTVYFIIDRLKKLGLANQSYLGKKRLFEMAQPEKLAKFITEEKEKLKKKEQGINKIISSLKVMASKSEFASDIKIYEGYDATMDILIKLGKTKSPTYSFYSSHYFPLEDYEKIKKTVAEFNKVKRMAKSKIYVITDHIPLTSKFFPSADEEIREFRFLPENIKLPAMVDISEDTVALSSVRNGYGCIVIKNKTIAETLRIIHGIVWQSLEGKNLPEEKEAEKE